MELALIDNPAAAKRQPTSHDAPAASGVVTHSQVKRAFPVISIATISSGFEKGDFLVREEKGQRVYFDFFEEVRADRDTEQHRRMQNSHLSPSGQTPTRHAH